MRENGIQVASFNGLTPIRSSSPEPLDEILAKIAKDHRVQYPKTQSWSSGR